jgi:uncharacterized delta-60 repeat protein
MNTKMSFMKNTFAINTKKALKNSVSKLTKTIALVVFTLWGMVAYAQDGTLDATFDPGTGTGLIDNISTIAVQPDGKVLIGGSFIQYNGTDIRGIARLNTDGSLDTTFDPGIGTNDWVSFIALQPDGKILIGGYFTQYNGVARNYIARLNTDGTLDTTFDPGSGASNVVFSIALQPDGKILIGGDFGNYNGSSRNHIARLNTDGTLDTTFNPGQEVDDFVLSIAPLPDGKILIGGAFDYYSGTASNYISRLNTDGSWDTSFIQAGTGLSNTIVTIAVQPDEKILVGGAFTQYNSTARNRIARLNANGSLDTTFDPGSGANGLVRSIVLQPDGKVLIGGSFTQYNNTSRNRIARLNANGSLDITFDPGSGANNQISKVALQLDGKILIGGFFTQYNSTARNCIARLLNPSITLTVSETEKTKISISPNPVKDILTIENGKWKVENAKIYDMQGKLVKIFSGNSVNVSDLQKGNYILNIDNQSFKFIKE